MQFAELLNILRREEREERKYTKFGVAVKEGEGLYCRGCKKLFGVEIYKNVRANDEPDAAFFTCTNPECDEKPYRSG